MNETDEAFANVYSGAVSAQNLFPRVSQRLLIACASVAATAGALAIDIRSYQRFLLLLGAVFVPLLGVLVAHWLLNGAHYTREDIFESPRFRLGSLLAWAAGFVLYEWLAQPADLGFWSDWLSHLPTPSYQVGASLPGFALAFVLTGLIQTLSSPRATITCRAADLDALNVVRRADLANSVDGRPTSTPWETSISSPNRMRPCRAR